MPGLLPDGPHRCQDMRGHTESCTIDGHVRGADGSPQQNTASQHMGFSACTRHTPVDLMPLRIRLLCTANTVKYQSYDPA